jgi:predicted ATPase
MKIFIFIKNRKNMDYTLEKKIISLEVINFKSIDHIKLNFKNNNINLIYGDNGIGKTTFVEIFDFINKL